MRNTRVPGTRWACSLALWGVAALMSSPILVGCNAISHEQTARDEGGMQVVGLALSQSDVTKVTAIVSGTPGAPLSFPMTKKGSQWVGTFGAIPTGTGYTVTINAYDTNNVVIYQGSQANITVKKNQIVTVLITAQQVGAPPPFANAAPVIDSLLVSSVEVAPGDVVSLTANAHDPNGDPLTYTWSATGGAFSSTSNAATSWSPSADGNYDLTIVIKDGKNAAVSATVTVHCCSSNGKGSVELVASLNNWPLVSSVNASPAYLKKGEARTLALAASDPDGDSLSYAWSTACSGSFSDPHAANPSFTLDTAAQDASCKLSVAVSDGRGGSTTGELSLPVGAPSFALPPVVVGSTQSATRANAGDVVSFDVQATAPAGGALTFAWSTTGGTLGTPTDGAGESQVAWTAPASDAASWQISCVISASNGAVTTQSFTVLPAQWTFGVMADTQWIGSDDGNNPNSVAVDIVNQVNQQFIAKGVSFVVQLGDLTDNGSNLALDTRATYAQALYNAGIGYFPLRGNHESSTAGAAEFRLVFPQTASGQQNATPAGKLVTSADDAKTHPAAPVGSPFVLGRNFSKPSSVLTGVTALDGLSYSFDYNNTRFVLLDQFMKSDGTSASGNYEIASQQAWISATLAGKPAGGHAFVFGHKGIITENHVDTLFGGNPSVNPAGQDAFINSLANNGVRYLLGGHDHMHNRSLITTTDGITARIMDIVCASDSSKFYIPANPKSNDDLYDVPAFGHRRQTEIIQELNTVGYYIFTVEGPRVTVDYYSAPVPATYASGEYLISTTPHPMVFGKRETFGYALNGKEFLVPQAQSYAPVQDSYQGTAARILAGLNNGTAIDGSGRQLVNAVDTGWSDATAATASNVLTLWPTVSALGSSASDAFALSMSYDAAKVFPALLSSGSFGLATRDASGNWVPAVATDVGGTPNFVAGPWDASYPLGTYGVDAASNTAWAVVNHGGDFAAAQFAM